MRDERLGNYRLVSCIGEGGMGAVYRAEHALLGREVAIKVLQPALSQNQDMVDRFFQEARATAQLHHPGIVDVFDFGHGPDGTAFLVMELLHGESLTRRIARDGRLAWSTACGLARQIASALAAAHRAQIVHRDLKPDNVFLATEPDQAERTKVLDFGIAKLTDPGAHGTATRADLILGTPAYMSPQQCRGAGQVDHRADIYALGCILFEMVCGRPPFTGDGFGDLLHAHMTMLPPAPRGLVPELPEALEQLILRMLAKAEADRPQSMDEVAAELDTIAAAATGARESAAPPPARPSDTSGTASRAAAITTFGGSAGQVAVAAPPLSPLRRLPYAFAVAAALGMIVTIAAVTMYRREPAATTGATAATAGALPPPAPPAAPPPAPAPAPRPAQPAEPPPPARVVRRVTSHPPGAELSSHGELLGRTPIDLRLMQSNEPQRFTLRLAGYLEQTIEIVPREAGATDVELQRAPPPVVHELACDPACEVVLDGAVLGTASPGRWLRSEFPAQNGASRRYVLRPLDRRYRETSYRAAADRSARALVRLPCAPRAAPDAPAVPAIYDPYDPCLEK